MGAALRVAPELSDPVGSLAVVLSFNGNQVARTLRVLTLLPVRRGPLLSANRSGRLGLRNKA